MTTTHNARTERVNDWYYSIGPGDRIDGRKPGRLAFLKTGEERTPGRRKTEWTQLATAYGRGYEKGGRRPVDPELDQLPRSTEPALERRGEMEREREREEMDVGRERREGGGIRRGEREGRAEERLQTRPEQGRASGRRGPGRVCLVSSGLGLVLGAEPREARGRARRESESIIACETSKKPRRPSLPDGFLAVECAPNSPAIIQPGRFATAKKEPNPVGLKRC